MSDLFSTPTDASSLRDAVVLVTGGASGLGRATCFALAEAGAEVVVADLSVEAGSEVADAAGGRFIRTDVSSLEDNEAMVAFAVSECGRLDHAYLNAGVATGCGIAEDFSPERYRRAIGANLDGVVFGAHCVLGALRGSGRGGSIVATASLAGLVGMPLDPIYTANKHAVVGLARALGPAYAHEGIRFNAVCPGFAESAIIADAREALVEAGFEIIPAESVAATVLRLMAGDMTGECWFVQPRREPAAFKFRNVPGPGDRAQP
jgi:NAD(P)-dependent dehydrogenase (short-subunit alcohol dehydrogenase family)